MREKVVARKGNYKILEIIDFKGRRRFYLMTKGGVLLKQFSRFDQAHDALVKVQVGQNPFDIATVASGLATGLGFGGGLFGMKYVIEGKRGKRPMMGNPREGMNRKGRWFDKRLKLEEGDLVKITPSGRKGIEQQTGLRLESSVVGRIESIRCDIGTGRYFAIVTISGKEYWMRISDLRYYVSGPR